MSKTALISALERFDLAGVRDVLAARPDLADLRSDQGLDLLQWCCKRSSAGDAASAGRQVRLAKWLVSRGFDPRALHTTAPGEDGEEPSHVSLVWFAVAKAQNNNYGADINEHVGATPLHMAVDVLHRGVEGKPELARRRSRTLREMLRLGADPNIAAHNGTTPLRSVLQKGDDVNVHAAAAARRQS